MIVVSSPESLQILADKLRGVSGIGVDTESDSFHAYREKTCLIQISTADDDYVIDPIAVPDLSALRSVFASPTVCKVFHAAENDVAGLRRDFGFEVRSIFDTMAAARILGLPRFGLGDLLSEHYGVDSDKRLQRYEWGRRPLAKAALEYAAMDSHYLLPLSQILATRLEEVARLEEAQEEFQRLESATARERVFDPEGWWRIKGAYGLAPVERAILRELYIWRDGQASALDRPPFRVAPDAALLAVAGQQPQDLAALPQVSGLPESIARRHGSALIAAVARGLAAPPPQPRRTPRPDDAVLERYEALRRWRRLKAEERGVLPDVVISNAVLQAVAERQPRTLADLDALCLLGPWKLQTYGADLLVAGTAAAQPGPILSS